MPRDSLLPSILADVALSQVGSDVVFVAPLLSSRSTLRILQLAKQKLFREAGVRNENDMPHPLQLMLGDDCD